MRPAASLVSTSVTLLARSGARPTKQHRHEAALPTVGHRATICTRLRGQRRATYWPRCATGAQASAVTHATSARLLRHPALEGVTRSARTDSPHRIGRRQFSTKKAAASAVHTGYKTPSSPCTRRRDEICTDGFSSSNWPETIFHEEGGGVGGAHGVGGVGGAHGGGGGGLREERGRRRVELRVRVFERLVKSRNLESSTCVTLNGSGIQLGVGPQPLRLRNHNSGLAHRIMVKRLATSPHDPLGITDSACNNQLVMVSVQYGPFNPYIPISSTTIGKSRVAIDPIAMHTSWRSNSDITSVTRDLNTIIPSDSIEYPRMSASGESSTTFES
ncbi:hypothetical protein F511_33808 [Dorcoceras hygrometricum]|uniref:Uncharacterized protein n=1 Tax=Dorcoceras hygrometricum TaxID=472368 RepID=A0A2Z7C1R8_9LAMI|nr:hypothetical protein F511_33808 [Dorcoceras hygrometricum]